MKRLAATAALLAGFLAAAAAQADSFQFSYSFDPSKTSTNAPVIITGTFDGQLETGGLIDNISNANLWINGTAYPGLLNISNGEMTGSAVISADVSQSDFAFFDDAFNNYFAMFGGQASALDSDLLDANNNGTLAVEDANNDHWSVSAVPEPNSFALLGAGVIAFGAASLRRRRQA